MPRARLQTREEAGGVVPRHRSVVLATLAEHLSRFSTLEGANAGCWPGMTTYRLSSPASWTRGQVRSITLVILVQGSHRLTVAGRTFPDGSRRCVVIGGHVRLDCEVLQASFSHPYLTVVLEIDPGLVRQVDGEVRAWKAVPHEATTTPDSSSPDRHEEPRVHPSSFERQMLEVVQRAYANIASDMDRHVLSQQYQHEIVYWLLNSDHGQNLRTLASADIADRRIFEIIEHVRGHLADPISVSDMAALAHLSASAFAHRFREVTGRPPRQFVKELRLHRARELLADGDLTVTQVSRQVGYASVSQFTRSFRGRFGVTPGGLARLGPPMSIRSERARAQQDRAPGEERRDPDV